MKHSQSAHRPRKQFGQNFLQDQSIISQIIEAIHPAATDCLVEIGPGQGALTWPLLPHVARLIAIELDRDLVKRLTAQAGEHKDRFTLFEGDALKTDYLSLPNLSTPFRLVGNLPYNISTPLLFHVLQYADKIIDMTFMLQKEVVDRIVATPGSKAYGRLSVMIQYFCTARSLISVPPTAFYPPPKVQSSVVRLVPHRELPHPAKDFTHFEEVVRLAFMQRRKTLANALKPLLDGRKLESFGFDGSLRAETLSVAQFVGLSEALFLQ